MNERGIDNQVGRLCVGTPYFQSQAPHLGCIQIYIQAGIVKSHILEKLIIPEKCTH